VPTIAEDAQIQVRLGGRHSSMRLLSVSEDPAFIHEMQNELGSYGVHVVGCLGPIHSSCPLMCGGHCTLATEADLVLVDSPTSGSFVHYWQEIQVGPYAELLQRDHPETLVIVCGAPLGRSGPSGEVCHVSHREEALDAMRWLARTHPIRKTVRRTRTKRRQR
jgi:hypothetical protein